MESRFEFKFTYLHLTLDYSKRQLDVIFISLVNISKVVTDMATITCVIKMAVRFWLSIDLFTCNVERF